MPWARASNLDTHLECAASSYLPRNNHGLWVPGYLVPATGLVRPNAPSAPHAVEAAIVAKDEPAIVADGEISPADWGTESHKAKAGVGKEPWQSRWDAVRNELYPPVWGTHEVTLAYNCETREVHLYSPELDGPDPDVWKDSRDHRFVVGTTDWWGWSLDGLTDHEANDTGWPWIDDHKTGWEKPEVLTGQTKFYALCRFKNLSWSPSVEGCRVSITHWPRAAFEAGDVPVRQWQDIGALALEQFEEELVTAWRRTMASSEARPGIHCYWCNSNAVCEAADNYAKTNQLCDVPEPAATAD